MEHAERNRDCMGHNGGTYRKLLARAIVATTARMSVALHAEVGSVCQHKHLGRSAGHVVPAGGGVREQVVHEQIRQG